jgi:glycosyltransferase involved in cell wall biosynthesis
VKILIVHADYQRPGGEFLAVRHHIDLLRSRGENVVVYLRDNAEIFSYGLGRKAAFFGNTLYNRITYHEVRELVKRERPDIAHVHNVFPLVSPSVYHALKNAGIPVVQTIHNYRFLCPNGLFYRQGLICERCKYGNTFHAVRSRCYRQSFILSTLYALTIALHRQCGTFGAIARFIALTGFMAGKLSESGFAPADKISILGNFLPDPLPQIEEHTANPPYLLFLGRLSPEKGLKTLLDSMVGLSGIGLKVAGDGPQAEELMAFARDTGLGCVEFLGHISGYTKWKLLKGALATVVPSVCYEAFGLSAIESLAAGTPVVASRLGGLASIIQHGQNGLLFEAGNGEDLRNKLIWLLEHPEETLTMGRHGRADTRLLYSASRHYEELKNIYRDLID